MNSTSQDIYAGDLFLNSETQSPWCLNEAIKQQIILSIDLGAFLHEWLSILFQLIFESIFLLFT